MPDPKNKRYGVTSVTDLRAQRVVLDLTQAKLARLLGVSRWSVARWESGERAVPKVIQGVMLAMTSPDFGPSEQQVLFQFLNSSR